MYCLIVWDKELAATAQDGCLDKVEIPKNLAHFFFQLDAEEFPALSSLSFDDYDMFSTSQMDSLIAELVAAAHIESRLLSSIEIMVEKILEAKSLRKSVLFDPFRIS